jgi:hypothetical protein
MKMTDLPFTSIILKSRVILCAGLWLNILPDYQYWVFLDILYTLLYDVSAIHVLMSGQSSCK